METNIKIEYEPINNVYLNINEQKIMLLSDNKKEISAKEILDCLNYERGKKYKLEDLSDNISRLDENNKNYIEQIYNMLKTITDGINAIE